MVDTRVLVGMSGGVDSSVAADLLKKQGYVPVGCILSLDGEEHSVRDQADAGAVSSQLGIELHILDRRELFKAQVKDYFVDAYRQGYTPNPCVRCNRYVKFQSLLEKADELGIHYISTGHYARVRRDEETGRWQLLRGLDHRKDQSYVLTPLTQEQLSRLLLPIGEHEKAQVREVAQLDELAIADRPDSQDICFIPDGDYTAFLERSGLAMEPGDFVDMEGRMLGRHRGQECYTTGQRRGLGVSADRPLYVVRKEADGRVILGDEKDLYSRTVWAENFNWVSLAPINEPMTVTAKTRYSQSEAECTLYPETDGHVRVEFREPQRAVTCGQTLAVYLGELVVGGGTICGAE